MAYLTRLALPVLLEPANRQAIGRLPDLRFCQNAGSLESDVSHGSRRNRRLARDFERYATTVAAFILPRHDPHHAQAACRKPLVMNPNFSDRL